MYVQVPTILEKPSSALIWTSRLHVEKGKWHATLFSFQRSCSYAWLTLSFTKKKMGVLAPGAAPDVYLKEKPRGGFLSASSHWFSRVGVNQTLPLLTLKLPQPFSLCPILLIQRLPVLQFGICLLITIENGQIFFFCNGHWTASTLCIACLCSTVIFFDKLSTCQQFPLAESQSWGF